MYPKPQSLKFGPLTIWGLCGPTDPNKLSLYTKDLYPTEKELLKGYTHPGRREEFILGRTLARLINPELGPLLKDPLGCPLWPEPYIGSITHKNAQVWLSLEKKSQLLGGIGIDLEFIDALKPELAHKILSPHDLLDPNTEPKLEDLTLIFSAKEALYKAYYPRIKRTFGFQAAAITRIDKETQNFYGHFLPTQGLELWAGQAFQGNYQILKLLERTAIFTILTAKP